MLKHLGTRFSTFNPKSAGALEYIRVAIRTQHEFQDKGTEEDYLLLMEFFNNVERLIRIGKLRRAQITQTYNKLR